MEAMPNSVLIDVARFGVVPVIAIDSTEAALLLADALIEGGLPLVEITFRTPAAAAAIAAIAEKRPQVLVGAGTVLNDANVKAAKAAGAKFAVAPGLNPVTVQHAAECGLPFVPGVAAYAERDRAVAGTRLPTVPKFFPAEASGGFEMLKVLTAPYAHTGVRFIPTGGASPANLESYLSLAPVAAVGGDLDRPTG